MIHTETPLFVSNNTARQTRFISIIITISIIIIVNKSFNTNSVWEHYISTEPYMSFVVLSGTRWQHIQSTRA